MSYQRRVVLSTALGLSLVSLGVQADERLQLEEVLVTAEKRVESLQDTPISIAAFSGEQLERFGVTDLEDLTSLAPNVDITPFPNSRSSMVVFMRGVGNNDSQTTQDPAVGVYIDGVYVGRSVGLGADVAALERVEVLRGPQGTLYGRNTTGGAINMISAKPAGEFDMRLGFSRGNRGHSQHTLQLDTPSAYGLSGKFSYMSSDKDGFVKNENPGADFGQADKKAWRGALRWELGDSFTVDYAYDSSEQVGPQQYYQVTFVNEDAIAAMQVDDPATYALMEANGVFDHFRNVASASRRDSGAWSREVNNNDTEVFGHTLTVSWDTPLGTLKSISAYRELEEVIEQDYGAGYAGGPVVLPPIPPLPNPTFAPGWFFVDVAIDHDQISQELQLVGNAGEAFDYVAGIYWYKESSREHEIDQAVGNLLEDRDIRAKNEALALYGQLTWHPAFADRKLSLTFGGRYTEDKRSAVKTSVNFSNSPNNTLSGSDKWRNFNPSFTADYAFNEDVRAYYKVVSGYKSGGYNVRSTEAGFLPPYDEENMLSHEIGLKSTWFENRLRVNAALYQAEYSDMQIQQILDNAAVFLTDVFNAGEAEVSGFEVDVTALLFSGLTVTASYGFIDAEFVEVIDNNPNNATFGQNVADSYTMPYAPESSYSLGIDYALDFSWASLRSGVEYSWRDDRFGTASNSDMEGFLLEAHALLNARIGLADIRLGKEVSADISAWGKNLTDEEYQAHNFSQGIIRSGYFAEPLTWGVDVSLNF